MATRLSR